jgi:hypothetical protein
MKSSEKRGLRLWISKSDRAFSDPAFDGEPVVIYEPKSDEPVVPPDEPDIEDEGDDTDYPDDDSTIGVLLMVRIQVTVMVNHQENSM